LVLPRKDVLAHLRSEIPGAIGWLLDRGYEHTWDSQRLRLTARMVGRGEASEETYLLIGTFEAYRALPPSWFFADPRNGAEIGKPAYPHPGPFPGGSILHTNGVICAPWNRLAYGDRGGPHSDWTDAANWQAPIQGHTYATTIPDMLARIAVELAESPHRMERLPDLEAAPEAA
jgi:hypothetical protein